MKSCGLSSIRSSGRPCRGASHVTVMKQIMRTKTLLTQRANSGGQAVVTSDEFGHVYRDVDHVVRKDPVGELISNWQATALVATSLLPALCGWVLCCVECLRPKRDAMHGAPSESCRAPVLVRLGGTWATRYRSPLRSPRQMGKQLLLWKVREEGQAGVCRGASVFGRG